MTPGAARKRLYRERRAAGLRTLVGGLAVDDAWIATLVEAGAMDPTLTDRELLDEIQELICNAARLAEEEAERRPSRASVAAE